MGKIIKLDDHLTNMIAAGEVVERPMGVVKELVENAIDAMASNIEVQLIEGGLTSITIVDNGHGMDAEDAVRAFHRHSTSKIKAVNDLWSINTLGFRGEALPSIASVAKVRCITNDGQQTTKIEIHYGKILSAENFASAQGTTLQVEGLFTNTPARLKHLKSVQYETAVTIDVMEKFALCYPHIAFTLISNQKTIFQTNGSGQLKEVVYRLYGSEIAKQAIEIEESDYDFTLSGILVLPHIHRASRSDMIIFANQRLIRSYRIQKAILVAYRKYLPEDRYPVVILNIKMDTKLIDVNVHPAKWEVRLSKEQQCEFFITKTIEKNLQQYMNVAPVKTPLFHMEVLEQTQLFGLSSNSSLEQASDATDIPSSIAMQSWVHEGLNQPIEPTSTELPINNQASFPQLIVLSQLDQKYILAEAEKGLYIIDQHAAMERIRYEYYQSKLLCQEKDQHPLLVPVIISYRRQSMSQFEQIKDMFARLSIEIEAFGEDQIIIRELPTWMKEIDEKQVIEDIFDVFEMGDWTNEENLRKKAISSMACHSSVRFNRRLTQEEMRAIIVDLSRCIQPYHCPHGRPTLILLDHQKLEKEFYR